MKSFKDFTIEQYGPHSDEELKAAAKKAEENMRAHRVRLGLPPDPPKEEPKPTKNQYTRPLAPKRSPYSIMRSPRYR